MLSKDHLDEAASGGAGIHDIHATTHSLERLLILTPEPLLALSSCI